ncbi:MAG: EFR1 family ferrodoxin [Spirochaetales bacterium]|nr:EFR1 family ferrodoxin [Spirochaetales bacterium]
MDYHIYYFTGTGNAGHSAGMISEALGKAGHTVSIRYINRWSKPFAGQPDRIVLVFPVYAGLPPALVAKFIKRLPRRKYGKTRAAVLAVAAGGAMAAPAAAARWLKRRGYPVHITASANYAENWMQVMPAPQGEELAAKTAAGIQMTKRCIEKIVRDEAWNESGMNAAFYLVWGVGLLYMLVGRRFLGKLYIADDKCTHCGLCMRSCPAGTIAMGKTGKARPIWKLSCEGCNRCINICPEKAVNTSVTRGIIMIALIAAACIGGFALYGAYVRPLLGALPKVAAVALDVLGNIVVVIAAHITGLAITDVLLRPLQAFSPTRRFLQLGFTAKFPRYIFSGFRAPKETGK